MSPLLRARALVSLLLLTAACAHTSGPGRTASGAPSADSFAAIVDDAVASAFAFSPTQGTQAGLHAYDGQLEDFSTERIQARVEELNVLLARMASVRRGPLSPDEQVDLDALDAATRSERLALEKVRTFTKNPSDYIRVVGNGVDLLIKRDFAPPRERLRSVISRLEAVPKLLAQGRSQLANPPPEFIELSVQDAKGAVGFLDGAVRTWAHAAAGEDAALQAAFTRADDRAVGALKEFADWVDTELRVRAHGTFALGPALFSEKLHADEEIDLPLGPLLARGRAQLEADQAAFVATARRMDPSLPPEKVMERLSLDHPSASELLPFVRGSVEKARRFIVDRDLLTLPSEARPRVEETPPYLRNGSFASMDSPGPFEPKDEAAYYYVTPVEPEWTAQHREEHLRLFNRSVVDMISVHELFPGHFTQFLFVKDFPSKTRKFVHVSSNAEGWAHYGEQMVLDQGLGGDDPKLRLAQLEEALLRDCRYVVGVMMHTQGMTVDEGTRVFVDKCFQTPSVARAETLRGTFDPTYLYYTYGKLEVQAMARDWLAQKRGTLKAFHDAFVRLGALPLPLVRKVLFR